MLSTDLKIGVISANFNLSGKIPSFIQELNILVSIGAQMSLFSFSSLMLTPVVDLVGSSLFISDKTSSAAKRVKSNSSVKPFCLIAVMLGWC